MSVGLWVWGAAATLVALDLIAASAVVARACPRLVRRRSGSVRSPLADVLSAAVLAYRAVWSGRNVGMCRFEPSCSAYALAALRSFGGVRGGLLAVYRLLRCQPLSRGGFDPVPARKGDLAVPSSPAAAARGHAGVAVGGHGPGRPGRLAFFRSRRSIPATAAADSRVGTKA
jgi:putative membrane protein insertion efficiency factor